MDITMAKQLVVKAGKELVESGLIARTWGNVSCRIDNNTFVITPSGRSYETLTTEEIVQCRIEDASYGGDIKPSSERRIHALVYQTHPDINFVIHTHQPMASIISAAGIRYLSSDHNPMFDQEIPIAEYGLPGTKKLRAGIEKVLSDSKSRAVIMSHHGALCFGKDYEETFLIAKKLEELCSEYLKKFYQRISGLDEYDDKKYYDYYVMLKKQNKQPAVAPITHYYRSRRTEDGFTLWGVIEITYRFTDSLPPEAEIHKAIYQSRGDINHISHNIDKALTAISLTGETLMPLLDDFAQIVGSSARCADTRETSKIVKALGNRMGVLVPGCGALCCAATESDLNAVEMVMEKNAGAQIGATILGNVRRLSLFDCKLMNIVYKKSYAKKAK